MLKKKNTLEEHKFQEQWLCTWGTAHVQVHLLQLCAVVLRYLPWLL